MSSSDGVTSKNEAGKRELPSTSAEVSGADIGSVPDSSKVSPSEDWAVRQVPRELDSATNQGGRLPAVVDRVPIIDSPHFLHPSSVAFEVIAQIRQYVVAVVFGALGVANGSFWGGWMTSTVIGLTLCVSILRYLTLRYQISDGDLVVTEGLLFRRVRSVPIRRIQNVDLVQTVFHRMVGVAVVNVETASGSKPEATLRVLSMPQIEQLRLAIFTQRNGSQDTTNLQLNHREESGGGSQAVCQQMAGDAGAEPRRLLWAISLQQLALAGLASNRGMLLLGVLLGYVFQNMFFARSYRLSSIGFMDRWSESLSSLGTPVRLVLIGGTLLVVLRLLGIVWYVTRFYGYRLTRQGEDLQVQCGLFTKLTASIPRGRLQLVSVQRTLFMRLLGLAAIRIETAGGGGSQGDDAAATVSRRWFVPVITEAEVAGILAELRPDFAWDEEQVAWQRVSPRTQTRLLRFSAAVAIAAAVLGLLFWRPWGWLIALPVFAAMALMAWKKAQSRRYARLPFCVVYQSGVFTRRQSFAFYNRIQTVSFRQSPFDRRWKMASLSIDTAAAGPADHVVNVKYLDEDFAREEFRLLRLAATNFS
ncbi:MAG: PH domain-containing protein [Planctomycetales bacterium]|nr:PH domain-containing protein [Planctomycetales bacterium]